MFDVKFRRTALGHSGFVELFYALRNQVYTYLRLLSYIRGITQISVTVASQRRGSLNRIPSIRQSLVFVSRIISCSLYILLGSLHRDNLSLSPQYCTDLYIVTGISLNKLPLLAHRLPRRSDKTIGYRKLYFNRGAGLSSNPSQMSGNVCLCPHKPLTKWRSR